MCPASWFACWQCLCHLHRLELGPLPDHLPDLDRAMKEYLYPAAGKLPLHPAELCPPAVLLATTRHLLRLADEEEEEEDGSISMADRSAFVANWLWTLCLNVTLQPLFLLGSAETWGGGRGAGPMPAPQKAPAAGARIHRCHHHHHHRRRR
ncbi:hypothetical protein JRQ81_019416 [Phrynocephalus forsythii]|uniref:SAC3/GANP/THP3 conserved domain-containing protein n=1 Tax=Phrynocephalus forsythii TaxID=171643 RepID=A0A9Q0XPB5_9SAUR|nr:hypothetical protein JRQ81_019416 [Phrynocephalus forsythii]